MAYETIIYQSEKGIATITLNRPHKLNALSMDSYRETIKALEEAEADPKVRVLILTGAGDRAFCAGDDISIFEGLSAGRARTFIKEVMPLMLGLERLDKPVIAAVNGYALGGGFEVALACDITIASENASFGLPEARVGIYPVFASLRLPQVMGAKRAKKFLLTGETIDAFEAERMGLVNRVVPLSQLLDAAREEARKIMALAPLGVTLTKEAVNRGVVGEEMAYSIEAASLLFGTEDHREGVRAFMEKREPRFKGK
ncbi:MAG: enoyl-CoA hydratase/isomerase family protein [Dehalococcoidia bacterium]